jgi:hypothetical protein
VIWLLWLHHRYTHHPSHRLLHRSPDVSDQRTLGAVRKKVRPGLIGTCDEVESQESLVSLQDAMKSFHGSRNWDGADKQVLQNYLGWSKRSLSSDSISAPKIIRGGWVRRQHIVGPVYLVQQEGLHRALQERARWLQPALHAFRRAALVGVFCLVPRWLMDQRKAPEMYSVLTSDNVMELAPVGLFFSLAHAFSVLALGAKSVVNSLSMIKFRCGSCGLESKERVGEVLPRAPWPSKDPQRSRQPGASRVVGLRSICGCTTGTGGANPTTRGTSYTTRYLQTVEECKSKGIMGYRMLTTQHDWENSGISHAHNAQFSVACLNCENLHPLRATE